MNAPLVLCSAKGSPGVTTTALALSGTWPSWREAFLIEADPAGGDIQLRLAALEGDEATVLPTPSTVQLAAATANLNEHDLLEYSQRLPGSGEVCALLSPLATFSAATALDQLNGAGLAREIMSTSRFDMLVDVGRIDARSPALSLVRAVGKTVIVARATFESVEHTRELAIGLSKLGVHSRLLLIGDDGTAAEVAELVGCEVIGVLPEDPDAAAMLCGTAIVRRRIERTRLVKAAQHLALQLAPPPPPFATSGEPQGRRRRRRGSPDDYQASGAAQGVGVPSKQLENLDHFGGNGHGTAR